MILKSFFNNPLNAPPRPWKPWYGYLFLVMITVAIPVYVSQRLHGGPVSPTTAVPAQVYNNAKAAREHQQYVPVPPSEEKDDNDTIHDVARLAVSMMNTTSETPALLPASIDLAVPFLSQSPDATWSDDDFSHSEEASAVMLQQYFVGNRENLSVSDARLALFTAGDLAFDDCVVFLSGSQTEHITIDEIKTSIAKGIPVMILVDRTRIGNPYYLDSAIVEHAIVIRGYTETQFITNDPGTKRGEGYRYDQVTIMNALMSTSMIALP